jgi:hypothetical protein
MPTATTPPADATGICDTHVHVLDPARFPYAGDRTYTPTAATLIELEGAMRHRAAPHGLAVQIFADLPYTRIGGGIAVAAILALGAGVGTLKPLTTNP